MYVVLVIILFYIQDKLLKILQDCHRNQTREIRAWSMLNVPSLIRESLIRRMISIWEGRLDRKSLFFETRFKNIDKNLFYRKRIVQKLWSFLFSHHMICIDIPPWIGKYLLSEKFFSIFYVYQSGEYNDLRIHFIEVDFVATFVVKTTQVPVQLLSVVDTGTCPSVVYYPLCFKMK